LTLGGTLRRFQILAQPLVLFLEPLLLFLKLLNLFLKPLVLFSELLVLLPGLLSLPPRTAQLLHKLSHTPDRIELLEKQFTLCRN
jgi:hypothetical protein